MPLYPVDASLTPGRATGVRRMADEISVVTSTSLLLCHKGGGSSVGDGGPLQPAAVKSTIEGPLRDPPKAERIAGCRRAAAGERRNWRSDGRTPVTCGRYLATAGPRNGEEATAGEADGTLHDHGKCLVSSRDRRLLVAAIVPRRSRPIPVPGRAREMGPAVGCRSAATTCSQGRERMGRPSSGHRGRHARGGRNRSAALGTRGDRPG